jgi:SAM-dependent methyltransferase
MTEHASRTDPSDSLWQPPSDSLRLHEGIWVSRSRTPISYPEAGNDLCFQVEDGSYWFRHRMECIATLLANFAPSGTFYDIGGGNGFVTCALQGRGVESVLLEPGAGALNARTRGCRRIIQATLDDSGLAPGSLPAAGAFDVLEHLPDDRGFLLSLRRALRPGARFYCTVPAVAALWSAEDDYAGHHRRYSRDSLREVLHAAGFQVEFISHFFAWLVLPVLGLRALPSRLGFKDRARVGTLESMRAEHRLPRAISGVVNRCQEWELARLRRGRPIPLGTSLLCVARANGS